MWEAAYRLWGTPGIQGEFPIISENLLFGWGDGIPKIENKMQKRCNVNPKLKDLSWTWKEEQDFNVKAGRGGWMGEPKCRSRGVSGVRKC